MDDSVKEKIPESVARLVFSKQVKDLYSLGWTYDEIAKIFHVSKTSIFFAIKGRKPKQKEIINNLIEV